MADYKSADIKELLKDLPFRHPEHAIIRRLAARVQELEAENQKWLQFARASGGDGDAPTPATS